MSVVGMSIPIHFVTCTRHNPSDISFQTLKWVFEGVTRWLLIYIVPSKRNKYFAVGKYNYNAIFNSCWTIVVS